jgi:hypothetical protein
MKFNCSYFLNEWPVATVLIHTTRFTSKISNSWAQIMQYCISAHVTNLSTTYYESLTYCYCTWIMSKSIQQTKSKQCCIVIFRALQCVNNHLQEWFICQWLLLKATTSQRQWWWWCNAILYSKDTNHIITITHTLTSNLWRTLKMCKGKFWKFKKRDG